MSERPLPAGPEPRKDSIGSQLTGALAHDKNMRHHLGGSDAETMIENMNTETKELWRRYQELLAAGFVLLSDLKHGKDQGADDEQAQNWLKEKRTYLDLIRQEQKTVREKSPAAAMLNLIGNTSTGLLESMTYALTTKKEVAEIWQEVKDGGHLPQRVL